MTLRSKWKEFRVSMEPRTKEWRFMLSRMKESPLSMIGIAIILAFVVIACLAPVLAPPQGGDPFTIPKDLEIAKIWAAPSPPSSTHFFGTTEDQFDIYYACIWGTITAFRVGITTVAVSLILGIIVGVAAAFYGGLADEALMRFTDVIIAFPGLILAMALVIAIPMALEINISLIVAVILGLTLASLLVMRANVKITVVMLTIFALMLASVLFYPFTMSTIINNLDKVLIALWIIGWPGYARVIRGEVLRVKNEDYVEASRASGASDLRIIMKHILPNAVYPILIMASLDTGAIVLTAAALSFLGLGAPENYADWGQIIQRSQTWITGVGGPELLVRNIHAFLIPGLFIFIFVLGWNLLGDAVRDVLDPTLRRR